MTHFAVFFSHAKTKWIVVQNNNCDFHFAYLSLILVVKECHFDTHLSYIDRYIGDSFVIIFTAETHIYGFTVCVTIQYTWQMKGNPPMDGLSGLQVNKNNMFLYRTRIFSCRCPNNVRYARPTHQYRKTKNKNLYKNLTLWFS